MADVVQRATDLDEEDASDEVARHAGDVVEGEVGSARMKEPSRIEAAEPLDAGVVVPNPVIEVPDER